MHGRNRIIAVVAGLVAVLAMECLSVAAQDIPFPQLPPGTGKIDSDASKAFATTSSGLQYRVLRKGKGVRPKLVDTVKVNYHGWLDGGKVFDSSYQRQQPASFPLNRVIKGWTEGMQLIATGGMIELQIPSDLAYGDSGRPPVIPPKATLHFVVELLEVQ